MGAVRYVICSETACYPVSELFALLVRNAATIQHMTKARPLVIQDGPGDGPRVTVTFT
jgi:hypothetical protein